MKKKHILMLVISLATSIVQAAPKLQPQFKEISLHEFTSMELEIMPDAGTQLIFPFLLDNPDLQPELKIRLTNSNGFDVPTSGDQIKSLLVGQNTISILGKANMDSPDAVYLGNLFITIGGYNISIALRTTHNTTEHISNIVFRLSEEKREHMVEAAAKRRLEQLEKEYNEKLANVENVAKEASLRHIAIMATADPKYRNFKEDGFIKFDDGRILVFIDEAVSYNDQYHVLFFELENKSTLDFDLGKLEFFEIDDNDEKYIGGFVNCVDVLKADTTVKCNFATQSKSIRSKNPLRFSMQTDRGKGAFQW